MRVPALCVEEPGAGLNLAVRLGIRLADLLGQDSPIRLCNKEGTVTHEATCHLVAVGPLSSLPADWLLLGNSTLALRREDLKASLAAEYGRPVRDDETVTAILYAVRS